MGLELRPYQVQMIDEARALMHKGVKSMILRLPTGGGKTAITARIIKTAHSRGLGAWFVCHRRELISQCKRAFDLENVPYGVVAAGESLNPDEPVQICSVGTLKNRLETLPKPTLIVLDECHHVRAGSWERILRAHPAAYRIGLSATPERLDGKGLIDWFDHIIHGPSTSELIRDGFLVPYKMFAPPAPDLSQLPISMGDYQQAALSELLDKPKIIGSAVEHYLKLAHGKRAVVFCFSIKHSEHVAEEFRMSGISAQHIDGETNSTLRDYYIEEFRAGRIQVLTNVDLFSEGFDLPAIEVVILLRPTKSLTLYLQQVGRALRTAHGKQYALILDHVNAWREHGLPDEEKIWSLAGRVKRSKKSDQAAASLFIKICDYCFGANNSLNKSCTFCGAEFKIAEARSVTTEDGQLLEINPILARQKRINEQGQAKTLEELIELGRRRKYKNPFGWAKFVFQGRLKKHN